VSQGCCGQKSTKHRKIHISGTKRGSKVVFALNYLENCQEKRIKKITVLRQVFQAFHRAGMGEKCILARKREKNQYLTNQNTYRGGFCCELLQKLSRMTYPKITVLVEI